MYEKTTNDLKSRCKGTAKSRFVKILSTNRLLFSVKRAVYILLAFAEFVVGVILPVGDDDMVKKVDTHQFAGTSDPLCQFIVHPAGGEIS